MAFYIDTRKNNPEKDLAFLLKNCICGHSKNWNELVFLCVGSDRVTGDCLGPYVGHQLSGRNLWGVSIYGTLQKPVHALNLARTRESIHRLHPHALVIAVDASLGQKKHLGYVTIGNGALYPGAGVQKDLPPVGDIHITGIVNICGHMEQTALQTTRLSTVISLGDIIVGGIETFLQESEIREKPSPAYKFPRRPVRIFPEALLPGRIRQTHR